MTWTTAHIQNHWQGTRYVVEEWLRPEFVRAGLQIETDQLDLIQRIRLNSSTCGTAEWRSGFGLTRSTTWQDHEEATAGGGWGAMFETFLSCAGTARSAAATLADVLSRLPLLLTRDPLIEFVAHAVDADGILTPPAKAELLALSREA